MKDDYLIVHKSILPEYFEQVIKVRELIDDEKVNVSEACKKYNISRSTYYKYKDFVFSPTETHGKKAIIAYHLKDDRGVLSSLLNYIASIKGNIITINQETPIHNKAYVVITINIDNMDIAIDEVINNSRNVNGVISSQLIAID